MAQIKKGDRVEFRPEFRTPNDEGVVYRAVEDERDTGSIHIRAELGLFIDPITAVAPCMLVVVDEAKGSV